MSAEETILSKVATISTKLEEMHYDLLTLEGEIHEMNGRQRTDHDRIVQLEGRIGLLSILGAGLTLIASTLAGWFGVRH